MPPRGKKSDLDFTVSYNADKAISDMAKQIAKQDAIIAKVKGQNKVTKDAMRQMTKAYKKAGDEAGRTKKQVAGIGKAASGSAATMVLKFTGTLVSIASVTAALKGVLSTLKEINQLRVDSLADAVIVERAAMTAAHLQRDVSPEAVKASRERITEVAESAHIPFETAEAVLFAAESSKTPGSPEAMTSAKSIGAFAGAAGLSPDEVRAIPKLFEAWGGDTEKKQMQILNQLLTAAGGSSAQTGEFIDPLVGLAAVLKESDFTFAEILGRLVAQVEVSKTVSKAAEDVKRYARLTAGQLNEKGMDFMIAEGKKFGADYKGLRESERMTFFGGTVFPAYKSAGEMDTLALAMGGESFTVAKLGASETAQAKYKSMYPQILEAKDSTYVQDMAAQYADSMPARSIDAERRRLLASAASGRKYEAVARLDEEVETVLKEGKKTTAVWGDIIWAGIRTPDMEKRAATRVFLRQQLQAMMPVYGTEGYEEKWADRTSPEGKKRWAAREMLDRLRRTVSLDAHPEFKEQIYDITGRFTAVEKFRKLTPSQPPRYPYLLGGSFAGRPNLILRGMANVYGLDIEEQKQRWEASGDVLNLRRQGVPQQDVVAAIKSLESKLDEILQANKKIITANEQNTQAVNNAAEAGSGFETGEGGLD